MAEQGIPGLSVALVDKDKVLWTQGFGHLDRDGSASRSPQKRPAFKILEISPDGC